MARRNILEADDVPPKPSSVGTWVIAIIAVIVWAIVIALWINAEPDTHVF